MSTAESTWTEICAPIIARCELASKIGMNATWNPDGAAALGELIKRMAATLDRDLEAVEAILALGQSQQEKS